LLIPGIQRVKNFTNIPIYFIFVLKLIQTSPVITGDPRSVTGKSKVINEPSRQSIC